jgi:hypothetical protein
MIELKLISENPDVTRLQFASELQSVEISRGNPVQVDDKVFESLKKNSGFKVCLEYNSISATPINPPSESTDILEEVVIDEPVIETVTPKAKKPVV